MDFAVKRAFGLLVILCLAFQTLAVAGSNARAGAGHGSPCEHALSNACLIEHGGTPCHATLNDCQGAGFCSAFAPAALHAAHLLSGSYPGFSELSRRCTNRVSEPDVPPPLLSPA